MLKKKFFVSSVLGVFTLFSIFSVFPTPFAKADDISIMSVSAIPSSGTVSPGQTVEVHLSQPDHMTDVVLDSAGTCTVNGKNISTLENLSDGQYRLMYTVATGDMDRAAGQLPLSCALTNTANQQYTISAFTDNNTVAIGGQDSGSTTTGTTTTGGGTNTGGNTNTASSTADGTINGNIEGSTAGTDGGVLAVTSVEQLNGTATAGGGFDHGWKWVFHITVPTNETSLQMSFNDWLHTNSISTLAAANNMRISSSQATGGVVTVSGSNVYTTPLTVTGDLNGSLPGRQIDVVVEMQAPTTAVNGSYSTSYHVKTLAQ